MKRTAPLALAAVFGFSLLGLAAACSKPEASAATAATVAPGGSSSAAAPQGRVIEIEASNSGFSPATVQVKRGEAVVLRFKRTTKSECLKAISIPELKISKDLPLDTPVDIPIKPEKEGKIVFQCWMAMVKGEIVVTGS